MAQKLFSVLLQIIILNIIVIAVTFISIRIIGEEPEIRPLLLLFLAYFILQAETAAICFGISAFISQSGLGIGLGIAALFYFLNIVANLTEDAKFLKYITPFGYTEGADIIADKCLKTEYLSVGLIFTALGIGIGFYRYCTKDIHS